MGHREKIFYLFGDFGHLVYPPATVVFPSERQGFLFGIGSSSFCEISHRASRPAVKAEALEGRFRRLDLVSHLIAFSRERAE